MTGTDAIRQGILYFATHKSLWKPLLSRLAPMLGLSAGVVASMFFFTYLPQLAVLVFVNGPLAVFTTVLLILNESSVIISLVSRNFLLQDALLDTFDGTLVARDTSDIVSEGRQLKPGSDPMERLGKILKSPFHGFSAKGLIRYVMYLPLNFIPGKVGPPSADRDVTANTSARSGWHPRLHPDQRAFPGRDRPRPRKSGIRV